MAGIARQVAVHGQPAPPPCVLISGGETTVTVEGTGRGGRNVEFLLSLAVELDGRPRIFAIAGDTDGVDGAEEVAGAIITPDSLERARRLGLNARALLADNDAHGFFRALGDQVVTGPTLTNVNDFRAVLVNSQLTDAQDRRLAHKFTPANDLSGLAAPLRNFLGHSFGGGEVCAACGRFELCATEALVRSRREPETAKRKEVSPNETKGFAMGT